MSRAISKNLKSPRPNIFRYHDYRQALTDWLAWLQASQSDLTVRKISEQAKIAAGYLSMVLSGKRKLSAKAIDKLAPALGLRSAESSYLKQLAVLGGSDDQKKRLKALAHMRRFRSYRNLNPKELEVHEYLTHWYYVAIREMSLLPDFKLSASWIQTRLRYPVEIAEIRKAIEFLRLNGLFENAETQLDCVGGVFRVALTQFHTEMLNLAAESITRVPSAERSITGHALPIPIDKIDEAKAVLSEALEKIKNLQNTTLTPEQVYYLEMAFFPLTQKDPKKGGQE